MFYYTMSLLNLFSIGFIMGLTGAMAPGHSSDNYHRRIAKRGGIVGPLVVLGHGILELVLLALIVFGVANSWIIQWCFPLSPFWGVSCLSTWGMELYEVKTLQPF